MKQLTEEEKNAKEVFKKLYRTAFIQGYMIGNPSVRHIQALRDRGEPLPDKYLPGRLLEYLTEEERESLKHLHPDLINDRVV